MHRLRNPPGDGAVGGDADDERALALEDAHDAGQVRALTNATRVWPGRRSR